MEYVPNTQLLSGTATSVVAVAYTKKLVVVSSGSYGSPLILERSGIGSTEILEKHGIEQIVDLPGVGERFQGWSSSCWRASGLLTPCIDHYVIGARAHGSSDAETVDAIRRGETDEIESEIFSSLLYRRLNQRIQGG